MNAVSFVIITKLARALKNDKLKESLGEKNEKERNKRERISRKMQNRNRENASRPNYLLSTFRNATQFNFRVH
jgi:hypothetical protein